MISIEVLDVVLEVTSYGSILQPMSLYKMSQPADKAERIQVWRLEMKQ